VIRPRIGSPAFRGLIGETLHRSKGLRGARYAIGGAGWAVAAAVGALWLAERPTTRQAMNQVAYNVPQTPDGRPNLNGIWQALTSASWDIQDHAARPSVLVSMGALGAVPAGLGIVEGEEIPYQPWAAQKQKENAANWLAVDPVVKCYLPGVPRATYMPFPFQIVQTTDHILIAYEFATASRTIYMNSNDESPGVTWMGWSRGRWEGNTLVVDVNAFNGQTWFDSAGNFHSDALRVVERYTPTGPDHLIYEATIEDSKVFTRQWTIRLPLYRRIEQHARLLEFKCVEFVEELMYGHLRKKTAK
jgi:hypothetical protein